MKKLIIILLLSGAQISFADEATTKWVAHKLELSEKTQFQITLQQTIQADTCNGYSLYGEFKTLTFKGEYYLMADLGTVQTAVACKNPLDSVTGGNNPPILQPKLVKSQIYKWKVPKKAKQATVLAPEGMELLVK